MPKNISPHKYIKKDGAKKIGLVPTETNKLYAQRYKETKIEEKEWMKPFKELQV